MDSYDELKEIDIENRKCYDFDDIIEIEDFNLMNIWQTKSHTKIFWFNIL